MSTRSSAGAGPSGLPGNGSDLDRRMSSRGTPRSMSSGALVEVRAPAAGEKSKLSCLHAAVLGPDMAIMSDADSVTHVDACVSLTSSPCRLSWEDSW